MDERKSRAPCGAHTELAKTGGMRITHCACGTVHLHVARSGVTLQLSEGALAELASATAEAVRDLQGADAAGESAPSRCIN
jgi:hypothetical protein